MRIRIDLEFSETEKSQKVLLIDVVNIINHPLKVNIIRQLQMRGFKLECAPDVQIDREEQ